MSEVSRCELPDRRSFERQNLHLQGCKGKGPFLFTCVNDHIVGLVTHFIIEQKLTVPCDGTDDCLLCRKGYERRPRGYIGAVERKLRTPFVAEIPEACWREIENKPLSKPSLRGRIVKLYRKQTHRNAPLYADLLDLLPADKIPPSFDPTPWISKTFGRAIKLLNRAQVDELAYGEFFCRDAESEAKLMQSSAEPEPLDQVADCGKPKMNALDFVSGLYRSIGQPPPSR